MGSFNFDRESPQSKILPQSAFDCMLHAAPPSETPCLTVNFDTSDTAKCIFHSTLFRSLAFEQKAKVDEDKFQFAELCKTFINHAKASSEAAKFLFK